MASYNARIDLDVNINKALSQIKKIESAIDRLSGIGSAGKEFKEALIPDVKGFRAIERELSNIKNRANSTAKVFARIFEGVSTAGVAGAGLQALNAEMFKLAQSTGTAAASIQELDKNTGGLSRFIPGFTALKDTVGASAQEVNKLQFNLQNFLNNTEGLREFVNKFYTMEGAAGAATAGLLALAGVLEGQLRESLGDIEQVSSKALGGLAEDAAKGTSELQRLINATQGTAKQYRNLIQVGEERRDSFNSASREARQATNTIVQAEKKLTDELRAQADLKRQAQGITVTELEASKGRQSIQTRQNAEAFRLKQLSEQEAVYQAIAKLNERDGTALQEKLGIQRNITNQVLLEAQRRESAEQRAATGLSRRIPTPYRTAGSMGFPVALPEIEQDRKIRAREEARQAAERALNLQKSNSLLTQGVTGLKAQVAIAEQLGGVYAEIVRSLERANDRQSQLFRARANRAQRQELGGENLQRLERINKLATNNVLQEQLKNKVALAGNAIKKNEFTVAKQIGKEIDQLLEAEDQRIDRARRVLRFRQRERQETRAIAKERAKSRKEALSNAIIGGAFPLLFGQGAGAAVGGGLGGAAGGLAGGQFGFGLSLVGTALGTAVDTFSKNISNLASSLNKPVEALEAFEEAGFKVDDSVKANVESLLEVGNAYEAQALVLKEISDTLGPQAVSQLAAYDEEIKKLEKSFQDSYAALASELLPIMLGFVTTINKLVAAFDNMPDWLKNLTSNTIKTGAYAGLFGIPKLQADLLGSIGEDRAKGVQPPEAIAEAESLKVQQDKALQILNQNKELNAQRDVLEAQLALASSGLNITTEQGYELAKKVIYAEEYEAVQRILNQNLDKELTKAALLNAELRKKLALQQLDDKRASELERQNKGTPSRALSLQRSILAEEQKQVDIAIQYAALQKGDLAGLKAQRDTIVQRQDAAIQMLALERQQTLNSNKVAGDIALINDLYDSRLETLKQQYGLEQATNAERIRAILLEEKLAGIRRRQQKEALSRELGQEIQSLALPTGNIYADPFTALERDQRFRRENIFADLRNQEELLQESLTGIAPKDTQTLADIDLIKKKRAEYEALLPVIEQNQKAQLVYNETLSQIQGPINSLIGGFQQVIAGTKSVEEAFADFLKTIADQLLQTAATMIAQYIALGIARAFAFGSSPQTPSFTAGLGTGLPLFGNYTGLSGNPFKGLANGGPATANSPYIVGERGPELFVPNSSGNVIPNDALGGTVINITNNISDEGSTSKTDAAGSAKSAADQLSKLMVAVIQREQRPGGVLSRR